jgi:hypothetical protein
MNPLLLLITIGVVVAQQPSPAEWVRADVATQRLDPSAFRSLPEALRVELRKRGCTISQLYTGGEPHNVVQGVHPRALGSHEQSRWRDRSTSASNSGGTVAHFCPQ